MSSINKKIFILYLMLFCSSLFSQSDSISVIIHTNSESTGFFIDNKFLGVGNKLTAEIVEGKHTLYLVENLREWNAEVIKDTIFIEGTTELILKYNFVSRSVLNTSPQDVYVYESDSLVGFTPTLIESGFTKLELEKPDYKKISITPTDLSNSEKPELIYIGEPTKTPFYGSALFTILLGTALALGATTAYLKLEADNKFEEYAITGDPELIDEVNQYDVASGATFVGLELNVALIIYFFLSE